MQYKDQTLKKGRSWDKHTKKTHKQINQFNKGAYASYFFMPGTSRYFKEYATIFVLTNTFLFCLMDDVINFQLFLFFSWVKYFDSEIIAHIRFLKGKA